MPNCRWLKDVDQTGVPVTLNWKGSDTHTSHFGGILSLLGIFIVGLFTLGTFYTFFKFDSYS